MNQILYESRCKCKENFLIKKKRKLSEAEKQKQEEKLKKRKRSEGKLVIYPNPDEGTSKTFQIKYEGKLSSIAKLILNTFQKKYLYYAIDDILELFQTNPIEKKNLLAILYSPVLSLHNNRSINFFDIWIQEISIHEISKVNKFLKNDSRNFEQFSYITIKFLYITRMPIKKPEPLW